MVPTAWELIDRLFKNYLLRIVILEHGQVLNKVVLVLFKNYGMSFRLKDNSNQEHVEATYQGRPALLSSAQSCATTR